MGNKTRKIRNKNRKTKRFNKRINGGNDSKKTKPNKKYICEMHEDKRYEDKNYHLYKCRKNKENKENIKEYIVYKNKDPNIINDTWFELYDNKALSKFYYNPTTGAAEWINPIDNPKNINPVKISDNNDDPVFYEKLSTMKSKSKKGSKTFSSRTK